MDGYSSEGMKMFTSFVSFHLQHGIHATVVTLKINEGKIPYEL